MCRLAGNHPAIADGAVGTSAEDAESGRDSGGGFRRADAKAGTRSFNAKIESANKKPPCIIRTRDATAAKGIENEMLYPNAITCNEQIKMADGDTRASLPEMQQCESLSDRAGRSGRYLLAEWNVRSLAGRKAIQRQRPAPQA